MNTASAVGSVAVVAHFDPEDRFDATFETLLDCLLQVCDHVLVVSTCRSASLAERFYGSVECIFRPNVGYDFYSYKVGIKKIAEKFPAASLFLINSSFLITDRYRFEETLRGIQANDAGLDMVSITQSRQIACHLQSYLLHLSPKARKSFWFTDWVAEIQPRNSKLEIILHDEIGLSINAKKAGAKIGPWFTYSKTEFCLGVVRWARYLIKQRKYTQLLNPRTLIGLNPVHFLGEALSNQCGLIKTELARNNPCQQNLDWFNNSQNIAEHDDIRAFVNRSKEFYSHENSGLTLLRSGEVGIFPSFRLINSGPVARPGVKIAVVLHLFYPELIGEFRVYLRNITEPFDLFVTTPHEGAVHLIFDGFFNISNTVCVALSENRGRDIGPFLALQRTCLLNTYDAVLKIHGKRSKYSIAGDPWRQRILNELVGTSFATQAAIKLLRTSKLGVIGPHADYLTNEQYWGSNQSTVLRVLQPLLVEINSNVKLGFFAGSMFWFNPKAIEQCAKLVESAGLVFEPENGKQDGTLAHAIERTFSILALINGFESTSLKLNGGAISSIDASEHFTPVIEHKTL